MEYYTFHNQYQIDMMVDIEIDDIDWEKTTGLNLEYNAAWKNINSTINTLTFLGSCEWTHTMATWVNFSGAKLH